MIDSLIGSGPIIVRRLQRATCRKTS